MVIRETDGLQAPEDSPDKEDVALNKSKQASPAEATMCATRGIQGGKPRRGHTILFQNWGVSSTPLPGWYFTISFISWQPTPAGWTLGQPQPATPFSLSPKGRPALTGVGTCSLQAVKARGTSYSLFIPCHLLCATIFQTPCSLSCQVHHVPGLTRHWGFLPNLPSEPPPWTVLQGFVLLQISSSPKSPY